MTVALTLWLPHSGFTAWGQDSYFTYEVVPYGTEGRYIRSCEGVLFDYFWPLQPSDRLIGVEWFTEMKEMASPIVRTTRWSFMRHWKTTHLSVQSMSTCPSALATQFALNRLILLMSPCEEQHHFYWRQIPQMWNRRSSDVSVPLTLIPCLLQLVGNAVLVSKVPLPLMSGLRRLRLKRNWGLQEQYPRPAATR